MLRQLVAPASGAVVRSELIATPGESPAALSEVTISTTPAAQEQRVTVIIKMSFGVSLCLASRLITAFTLTKRDNESSGMVRSADSAIEAMMHGQARGKATTVPEVGRGLPWRSTDRKTAGDILRHFMRAAGSSTRFTESGGQLENRCDVATYLPG